MKIKGIMPALVTPLNEDESINLKALKKLMDDLILKGADGFYIGGATGEGLALRTEERKILAEASVKNTVESKKPCIIQIASMNFSDAIILAKHAEEKGAAAISATAPLFFSYSENDVYNYYKKIASAVHIPLMVYYNPFANFPMDARFAKRLFEIDNVTSIKWTSSDFYQMLMLKEITNGEMGVINGFDEMLLSGLSAGADGGIGSTYNYQLENVKGVYEAFTDNDINRAREYQKKASEVVFAFNGEPIIPASKAVLECMGYEVGNATFPMKRYTDEEKLKIYNGVKKYLP